MTYATRNGLKKKKTFSWFEDWELIQGLGYFESDQSHDLFISILQQEILDKDLENKDIDIYLQFIEFI